MAYREQLDYVIRTLVDEILRDGARTGRPVVDVWDEILRRTLHETQREMFLPALTADLRKEWGG